MFSLAVAGAPCFSAPQAPGPAPPAPAGPTRYATTAFMEPDRCSVAWVLQRRLEPDATFEFYERDAFPPGVVTFDLPNSDIKRDARRSALEVLLDERRQASPFLTKLARLVHDVEIAPWSRRRSRDSMIFEGIMVDALTEQEDPSRALALCFELLDSLQETDGDVEAWAEIWQDPTGAVRLGIPFMYGLRKPGLDNLLRISERIYSGSEPHGAPGFGSLKQLGVQTVVSVDGARPDLDGARAHGLRYIHIPIGYDGVPPDAAAALRKVSEETAGKIYVHCHHGKHRGPVAAAILLRFEEGAPREVAEQVLSLAGTDPGYAGLWRDVRALDPAAVDTAGVVLQQAARLDSFAAQMAHIDRVWDRLKLSQDAAWQTPADHPDIDPPHEALMLVESFTEYTRLADESRRDPRLLEILGEARTRAAGLRQALSASSADSATEAFRQIEATCKRCHRQFRDDLP